MGTVERLKKYKQARKNPKGPVKRLYSIAEAAYYLGRTVDALREVIWAGRLAHVRDGRRILIDINDMNDFIDRNKERCA